MVMQRGVSLTELESGTKTGGFDSNTKGFSKKEDKTGKIFWIAVVAVGVVILGCWCSPSRRSSSGRIHCPSKASPAFPRRSVVFASEVGVWVNFL